MANEQQKTPQGLAGLRRAESQIDANSQAKVDNADQTKVDAPNTGNADESADLKMLEESFAQSSKPAQESTGAEEGTFQTQQGDFINADDFATQAGAVRFVSATGGPVAEGETVYTSHPASNLKIGPFQFENGSLSLKGEKLQQFEKMINSESFPESTRNQIRKLDVSAVERLVEGRRAAMTRNFDSSVGREAVERLHALQPTVGMQDIAFDKSPQHDNNVPVIPNPPIDDKGETGIDQGAHREPDNQ